jgi:hypothetical protein
LIAKWANITTAHYIIRNSNINNRRREKQRTKKENKRNITLIYPKMRRKKCGY